MHLRTMRSLFPVLALCLCAAGCTAALFAQYGRITPDWEVTKEIEGYQVDPDLRYYITGSDLKPVALMGLVNSYRLDPSTTWREVNMSPVKMAEIIINMRDRAFVLRPSLQGFRLLDGSGRPIGIWYSALETRTFVRINNDGTVWIDTPGERRISP